MAKPTSNHERIKVELEVTPDWWLAQSGVTRESWIPLVTRAMLLAIDGFDASEIRVSRCKMKLIVFVPSDDVTLAALCERASSLREKMNALENPGSQR